MTWRRRSLKEILAFAWLIPGIFALVLSVCGFLVLGWVDYRNALQREVIDLDQKSAVIARRLAAEVLLGERGSVETVSKALAKEFAVSSINVTRTDPQCLELRAWGFCFKRTTGGLALYRPLPYVQDPAWVAVKTTAPRFIDSLNPRVLLWSGLPILLILGFAAFTQRWLLKQYLVGPVSELASHATVPAVIPDTWPKELVSLSEELREAFLKRDLAMVGQISSGIIHDLKTLLHSTWASAELAREQSTGSEKRVARLEAFLRAAETNFPKMLELIESTLDGAREIRVRPVNAGVDLALNGALRATDDLAKRSGVRVEVDSRSVVPEFQHDPMQLERVLTNLIKNGVEAAAGSDRAERRVSVRVGAENRTIKIAVEDSGDGLGFQRDSVFRSVRSTKPHGTGLGLVISQKIIQAHRGQIRAGASQSLPGARFEIEIPMGEVQS